MTSIMGKIYSNKSVYLPLILFTAAFFALAGAFISQYGFGFEPCKLCIYQRIPYAVVMVLCVVAFLLRNKKNCITSLLLLCIIAFGVELYFAGFHVGVEQKWWTGTESCGGNAAPDSLEALRVQIMAAPITRCDDPSFYFLGITMAAWNFIYSVGLLVFTIFSFLMIRKSRHC